jgi:TonB family protein
LDEHGVFGGAVIVMKITLLIFLLLLSSLGWCQLPGTVCFYNKQGQLIERKDSAYYSETTNFKVAPRYIFSNYLDPSAIRMKSSAIDDEGNHLRTYYYPNGRTKAVGKFRWGSPVGAMKSFYENGTIQADLEVPERTYVEGKRTTPDVVIMNYWDSLGNQVVKNGDGRCACNVDPFSDLPHVEMGEVRKGLKTGTWTGSVLNGTVTYTEEYQQGLLVSGISNWQGQKFEYTEVESSAAPRKGMADFYNDVGKRITYPRMARRLGIEGHVYVEFVIQQSGELTDVKVIKGIGGGCDEEAARIIKLAPPWEPGYQRGRKVRQRYTLPIIFKLG